MVNVYVISSIKYLNVFGEIVVLFKLLAGVSRNVYVGSKQYHKVSMENLQLGRKHCSTMNLTPLAPELNA